MKNEDYIGGAASHKTDSDGLKMKDEDEWKKGFGNDDELEGEDAPGQLSLLLSSRAIPNTIKADVLVVGKAVATFQKGKSAWSTVGSTSLAFPTAGPSSRPSEGAGADEVQVKQEPGVDAEAAGEPEAAPAAPAVQMTKRKGGLRTAKQLREEAERQAAEREPSPELEPDGAHTKTVHRDASGRIVDVEKLREEELAKEREEERKKREREEWTKGFTQRRNREERAREEKDMADQDLGRSAGDVRMNREMRETESTLR